MVRKSQSRSAPSTGVTAVEVEPPESAAGPNPHDKSLSRTKRKEASKALQQMGQRLAALKPQQRASLSLDADILAAIDDLNSISSHGAHKRQMLYLGKLLRRIDASELIIMLEQFDQQARQLTAGHQRAEQWRDYLLEHGDQALQSLLAQQSANHNSLLTSQSVRALLRQIQQQQQAGKPAAASRKLFRLLHAADQQQPLPVLPGA